MITNHCIVFTLVTITALLAVVLTLIKIVPLITSIPPAYAIELHALERDGYFE